MPIDRTPACSARGAHAGRFPMNLATSTSISPTACDVDVIRRSRLTADFNACEPLPVTRVSRRDTPASRAVARGASRPAGMPKEVGRCAGKSSRSRRSASSTVQVCETRARRICGITHHDQPSRSARVRARRPACNPTGSSTKSWVRGPDAHDEYPPDVQVPRRPVELEMVATRPPRCTSRHTPGARACALRWGRPSFTPQLNGGYRHFPPT